MTSFCTTIYEYAHTFYELAGEKLNATRTTTKPFIAKLLIAVKTFFKS